jgi:hypothetical protein
MVHKDYNGVSYPSDKLFLKPLINSATIPGHFGQARLKTGNF